MHKRIPWLLLMVCVSSPALSRAGATKYAWWPGGGSRRMPVRVRAFSGDETHFPVQVRVNFNGAVADTFRLDAASIRVVEHDVKTGRALTPLPLTVSPVGLSRLGLKSLACNKAYDGKTPPLVRATRSGDIHPAKALVTGQGYWEPVGKPPYGAAVDLGRVQVVHSVWVRNVYNGYGQHQMRAATIETATQSDDGLGQGNWQKVASWDLSGVYVNGMYRAAYFTPRPARYVRLTITSVFKTPRLANLRVYGPAFDGVKNQDYAITWTARGKTTAKDRVYFVYFDPVGTKAWQPAPVPDRPAFIREAELMELRFNPSGVGFHPAYDQSASGAATPNLISITDRVAARVGNVAGPITVPTTAMYSIHFRMRGNLREHPVHVLVDNKVVFSGTVAVQGEDWSYGSLLPIKLEAGQHSVEVWLGDPTGKPLQLDFVLISADPDLLPRHFLVTRVGEVEARP